MKQVMNYHKDNGLLNMITKVSQVMAHLHNLT